MIKNYTSSVPVERTIRRIEQDLAKAGACGILKDYDQGRLTAISFRVNLPTGKMVTVRFPANAEAVYQSLRKQIRRPRQGTLENLRLQSDRTAWKLMQDWIEVQLSLIEMQQVDFLQVFLPYVWDGQRTYYQALKEQNFLALPETSETSETSTTATNQVTTLHGLKPGRCFIYVH